MKDDCDEQMEELGRLVESTSLSTAYQTVAQAMMEEEWKDS